MKPSILAFCVLQGQLIAESGTMSGGAGRPMRGRMTLGTSAAAVKGGACGTSVGAGLADAKALAAEIKAVEQLLEKVGTALSYAALLGQ
jgi:hypothetical protein